MLTRMQQLALKPDGEMSIGTQHWGVVNGKLKTWCSYQIYNNTAKTYTVVDELTSSKTTYPIGIDADPTFEPSATCEGEAAESIFGFTVVKQETTVHRRRISRFLRLLVFKSPSLHCLPLQKTNGNGSYDVLAVVNVSFGQPPTAMLIYRLLLLSGSQVMSFGRQHAYKAATLAPFLPPRTMQPIRLGSNVYKNVNEALVLST
ncbi:MAG: hypothetical protein JO217_06460 [Acidobacteriaceae bacterium]|nr:hypothetical protein [Acidobacteriaceae bacterium]